MNNRFARQRDLVDEKIFQTPICIVGVGGIGSFTALTLAKMGFDKITCFDDDTVSEVNLPNQFYREEDVQARNRKKVFALHSIISDFTGTRISPSSNKFPDNVHDMTAFNGAMKNGIIISAVDSINARKDIYEWYKDNKKKLKLTAFIDGRMGRHQAEVYVVKTTNDEKEYEKRFWNADQVDHLRCTEKAIIYNVLFIAAMICSQIKLLLEGKFYKRSIITDLENMDISLTAGGK